MTPPESEFIDILRQQSEEHEAIAPKQAPRALPRQLPILGLSDIVIFPGMISPLLVETQQSIQLVDEVVAGDRFIGLVLQRRPDVENPLPEHLWEYGCLARVTKMLKFPDNTVRILVEGLHRFRIAGYASTEPYLCARVDVLPEVEEETLELKAVARKAQNQFKEIMNLSPAISEQVKVSVLNAENSSALSDLIAANLNLNLEERQELLQMAGVKARLSRLLPLLGREVEVLNIGSKIQNDVASAMSKSQREFFLREQMRAIQRELGEGEAGPGEVDNLRLLIEKNQLPEEIKKVALKELDRLKQTPPAVAEYTVTRNYLDWLVTVPWSRSTTDTLDLAAAERIFDEQHFGLKKVKDRLLEFLAVIQLKNNLKGPILCLAGPPGVGKTSLGKSVADALGRKFARISLGGMRDEAEIRGHRRTYVGAMPGRIIQTLRRLETNNPVLLLDELDKIGSDFRGDPASALLEVLDPQQNKTFLDNYLDLPFDLSRVIFITTANWLDPINVALRDRLEVIELPSYTTPEKLQIARRHLAPRQLEEHGLKPKQVRFPDKTLQRLIQDYTREAGCRQLERELGSLARKAARQVVANPENTAPITITPDALRDYLGAAKFERQAAESITELGIATGLAWTPVGGEILFIEATRMPGKGTLTLTGSLGDVMKESAQTALSYLRSQAKALKIDLSDYDRFDIHVHVPAGATPKDGPSAGVTLVVALASLFTQRRVRSVVAMTGEISLRGRVLPVGGVKEKVLAAARAGIKEVILPAQNRKDWDEVPVEVREKMKAHFVSRVAELLPAALA